MKVRVSVLGFLVAVSLCLIIGVGAWAGQETQTFDTAPSDWVSLANSPEIAGWSNTNNAGSAAGEAYTKVYRKYDSNIPYNVPAMYYADTSIGTLAAQDALNAEGNFRFTDWSVPDFGYGLYVGWFDPNGQARIAIRIPDLWYDVWALAYVEVCDAAGNRFLKTFDPLSAVQKGTTYSFSIGWDYDGGANGKGSVIASITPQGGSANVAELDLATSLTEEQFSAFGLFRPNCSPAEANWGDFYADDLTYTSNAAPVPEPGTLPALALGIATCGLGALRRKR